jgi:hypothetical protein
MNGNKARKSLSQVGVEYALSNPSAHRETKILKLHPYRIRAVHLFPLDWEAQSWYPKQFQELVVNQFLDPKRLLFAHAACLH